jgi:hypothetical protein
MGRGHDCHGVAAGRVTPSPDRQGPGGIRPAFFVANAPPHRC